MKRHLSIIYVLIFFAVAAISMVVIYEKGKESEALVDAEIPQETIDWINGIGKGLDDIFSTFNPNPRETPWDNDGDFGKDTASGYLTFEDSLFVFYYHEELYDEMLKCQKMAHDAIPRLVEVCGRYYYPADMNGRKVPIYLTRNQKEFESLMKSMNCSSDNWGNTAGVHVSEVSPSGYYLRCLALNGKFAYSSTSEMRHVLWHEMNHYCFFASVNYSVRVNIPMWCYEGLAEYSSRPGENANLSRRDKNQIIKECDLSERYFPYVFEVYQGGHSIFNYMESRYGLDGVRSFLQTTYSEGVATACRDNFSISLGRFEKDWKDYLR